MSGVAFMSMATLSPLKRSHEFMDLASPAIISNHKEKPSSTPHIANSLSTPQNVELKKGIQETEPTEAEAHQLDLQNPSTTPAANAGTAPMEPPTKKRKKLTETEKQQKEEEKARKEAEKREKEEEKKRKQAQAEEAKRLKAGKDEEKKKAREAEKAKKDEAKKQKETEKKTKEDEKARKERSQKRISNFFTKAGAGSESAGSSRRNSVVSIDGIPSLQGSPVKSDAPRSVISDYDKAFRSFFLHAHTSLAPTLHHPVDEERAESALQEIIKGNEDRERTVEDLASFREQALREMSASKKRFKRYAGQPLVKDLLSQLNGSASSPVDLTSDTTTTLPSEVLRSLPVKYLKYHEDVRPPWIGTYTRRPISKSFMKLCRNPFIRALPKVNYDYDSEAEWEEPEEGEDLGSEDEEENEEEDGDMEGFLDDEDAEGVPKRKQLLGDMEPVFTSMHWEPTTPSKQARCITYGQSTLDLHPFQMDTLLTDTPFPIDPYSTTYWTPHHPTSESPKALTSPSKNPSMAPPFRNPLDVLKSPNKAVPNKLSSTDATAKSVKLSNAKPLSSELLDDFKKAVDGSDLTKLGLIEVLKKKFPSVTKNTVEQTLSQVAERVGSKASEKKWKLL